MLNEEIKTIMANIINISLPSKLQHSYENFELYISKENYIMKSYDYIINKDTHKKEYTNLKDANGNRLYKISDLIQIVWETTDHTKFITTYKPKYTEELIEEYQSSYGLPAYKQTRTIIHDYLRTYLLKDAATQHPLDLNLSNAELITTIIKNKLPIQFKLITKQNGQYTNLRYYPLNMNNIDEEDIEDNLCEITE